MSKEEFDLSLEHLECNEAGCPDPRRLPALVSSLITVVLQLNQRLVVAEALLQKHCAPDEPEDFTMRQFAPWQSDIVYIMLRALSNDEVQDRMLRDGTCAAPEAEANRLLVALIRNEYGVDTVGNTVVVHSREDGSKGLGFERVDTTPPPREPWTRMFWWYADQDDQRSVMLDFN